MRGIRRRSLGGESGCVTPRRRGARGDDARATEHRGVRRAGRRAGSARGGGRGAGWPAILESGPGFGDAGRFSIYTAEPRLVFEATGARWSITDDRGAVDSGEGDPLGALDGLVRRFGLADPSEEPDLEQSPFQGGLIGFLGYDLAPMLERLPRRRLRDSRLPDMRMALYDTAILHDARRGTVRLMTWDLTGEGRAATELRCERWRRALERNCASPSGPVRSCRPAIRQSVRSPATSTRRRSVGCWSTSRRGTSSR